VPADNGHGPDGGAAPLVTDPVALNGIRRFQVRISRRATGLSARGVARPAAFAGRVQSAGELPPDAPAIVSRAQWLALVPRATPVEGEVQLAFVHHTVSLNDYSADESPAMVRAIQRYHRDTLGWNDIGYNFLVDRYGQVFEGRAGGLDRPVIGAHAQGYNSVSTGIALIGTYSSSAPSPAAVAALERLLAWKLSVHAVPAEGQVTVRSAGGESNRFRAGREVTLHRISGHREGDSTECPGQAMFVRLPALRRRVAVLWPGTGPTIAVAPGRVDYLSPATATGRIPGPDAVGREVEVQALEAEGWQMIAAAVTDASGAWRAVLRLPYTRQLRTVVAATATLPAQVSPEVRLEVRSVVRAEVRQRIPRRSRRLAISGHIEPRKRRQRAVVAIDRRAGPGRYRRIARLPTTVRDGRLQVSAVVNRPGLYRIRIVADADRLNARTRSEYVFARVLHER
jgi:hypothetical protein